MSLDYLNAVRRKLLMSGKEFEISVSGNSMEPFICNNDKIRISYCSRFHKGDILVFVYEGTVLVHRIIRRTPYCFFCKGDNSFRIEKVIFNEILGKVICVNDKEIISIPKKLIHLSAKVGKIFEKKKCVENICNSSVYKKYKASINDYFRTCQNVETSDIKCTNSSKEF